MQDDYQSFIEQQQAETAKQRERFADGMAAITAAQKRDEAERMAAVAEIFRKRKLAADALRKGV